jgi:O-antigen ligase
VTALPAGLLRDRPAYLYCFIGCIVTNMFSGNASHLGFPVGPDRLLFFAGVVLLLLDPEAMRAVRLRPRLVHVLAVLMVAIAVWSAFMVHTLTEQMGYYALLDRLIVPFAFLCCAPIVFRTRDRRDLLLKALVLVALYLGATAFFEMIGPKALVFPRYITDPSVGIHYGRARGPFVEAVADGLAMTQCGFAAAFAVVQLRGRWRWVAGLAAVLCGLGVLLTLTRSVWLGAIVGGVLVCISIRELRRFLPALVAAGVVGVFLAFALVPGLSNHTSDRLHDQLPVWDRQNTNAAAWRAASQHPLTGIGWMKFIQVGPEYVQQAATYPITNVNIEVHNVFLSRAAELGFPAAGVFVGVVLAGPGFALARGPRRSRSPDGDDSDMRGWWAVLLGGFCVWISAAMLTPLPYALPNLLLWLETGLVLSAYQTRSRPSPTGSVRHDRRHGDAQVAQPSRAAGTPVAAGR